MKILFEGDRFVKTILGTKKLASDTIYRWSDYAVSHTLNGKQYLYNNFTKRIYSLENESFDVNPQARFTSAQLGESDAWKTLVAESFLVPEKTDETANYVNFCKLARALKMKNKGFSGFTILPTTACNARCVYCFEQGMKYVTMKDETVAQTIEFIKNNRNPDVPVSFHWFGGEPLVGEKIIDKICAGMREADIPFKSFMVTNSALINETNLKKMKNDWNITGMQITLDGVEEEYNRRKNYYFNYDSAYWHVLSRIKMVNEQDISISIRVNVDNENIGGVLQMADDLQNFIVKPKLIRIYLSPLFDLQASENNIDIWEKSFEVSRELENRGFDVPYHYSVTRTKFNFCMADSVNRSLVVSPEGMLHNCEHIGDIPPLGDVWHGVTNTELFKQLTSVEPVQDMCRGCFSLPYCTTFTGCDHSRLNCKYVERRNMEHTLNKAIRRLEAKESVENEVSADDIDSNNEQEC